MTLDKHYMEIYSQIIREIPKITNYLLFVLLIINVFQLNVISIFVIFTLFITTFVFTHSIKNMIYLIQEEPSNYEYIQH